MNFSSLQQILRPTPVQDRKPFDCINAEQKHIGVLPEQKFVIQNDGKYLSHDDVSLLRLKSNESAPARLQMSSYRDFKMPSFSS